MFSKTRIALFSLLLVAVGCARSAPPLPPDYVSDPNALASALEKVPPEIKKLDCEQINAEIENLTKQDQRLEEKIQSKRGKNQTVGYIAAVLFLPAILAAENDEGSKSLLDENQVRRDNLIVAFRGNACPGKG